MISSVSTVLLGIVCIAASTAIASLVLKIIGIVVVINSLLRIYDAYKIKGRSDHFLVYVINDVLTFVLGIVLLILPLDIASAVVIIIGVILLILGISNVITAIRVYLDGRYVDDGTDVVWEE